MNIQVIQVSETGMLVDMLGLTDCMMEIEHEEVYRVTWQVIVELETIQLHMLGTFPMHLTLPMVKRRALRASYHCP